MLTSYDTDLLDDPSKSVRVQGVKGVKSTPFTKTFKNWAAYERWTEREDAGNFEVYSVEAI